VEPVANQFTLKKNQNEDLKSVLEGKVIPNDNGPKYSAFSLSSIKQEAEESKTIVKKQPIYRLKLRKQKCYCSGPSMQNDLVIKFKMESQPLINDLF
jgi:hypothetical protein